MDCQMLSENPRGRDRLASDLKSELGRSARRSSCLVEPGPGARGGPGVPGGDRVVCVDSETVMQYVVRQQHLVFQPIAHS